MAEMTQFQNRAAGVRARLKMRGITIAEAARQIGYTEESGTNYVRQVLGGHLVSNPILDRVEAFLNGVEKAAAA